MEYPDHSVFPHTLLVGQGGLGKTTLAFIIKNELELIYGHPISFHALTPSQLKSKSDLDKLILEIKPYDIVFVDEIHGLSTNIAESLYQVLEGGYYHLQKERKVEIGEDIYIGSSDSTFSTIQLPKFTCIGGTTEGGDLPRPLIMRFHQFNLKNYSLSELEVIIGNYLSKSNPEYLKDYIGQEMIKKEVIMEFNALRLARYIPKSKKATGETPITKEAKEMIAKRSFGTARIAIKYAKKCRSYAWSINETQITKDVVLGYMKLRNIDHNGLTPEHVKALTILLTYYPKEASTNALVEKMNVSRGEVEKVYFPDLTFAGLAERSPRSWRMATEKALTEYNHLLEI
jgi:Holliday junction DNA helicase RuvB